MDFHPSNLQFTWGDLMKKIAKFIILNVFLISFLQINIKPSRAQTLDLIQHIHNVKAIGNKILLGTHHGLYEYSSLDNIKLIGNKKIDLMGLAITNNILYASGHPEAGSNLKNPLGLIKSTDGGKNWKTVALEGKVDFHFLEVNRDKIYGVDAASGKLLFSADGGKNWKDLGINEYQDLSISNPKTNEVYAIKSGQLLRSTDSFKSIKTIKTIENVNLVEVLESKIFVVSGNKLFVSQNQGKNWRLTFSFREQIVDLTISSQILVAVSGSKIYVSKDGGTNFITSDK